jgi:hypothetical protein
MIPWLSSFCKREKTESLKNAKKTPANQNMYRFSLIEACSWTIADFTSYLLRTISPAYAGFIF